MDYPQVDFYREMDNRPRYDLGMADDLSKMLQEIMGLTGDKQAALGKRLGVSQSTIWRWLNRQSTPSITEGERVRALWLKAKGWKVTLDEKIAPYDSQTQATIHQMVDNYLRTLPPPPLARR